MLFSVLYDWKKNNFDISVLFFIVQSEFLKEFVDKSISNALFNSKGKNSDTDNLSNIRDKKTNNN